ncbi:uncharacterized protein LOC129600351 [Paramacrobiotus metropolitanus]|uniref:uncharacterized protein LOC129600351 n=1 Tax=Paramacrobiotus metropolitanus TaxID=2943436 RepID=UPI002445ADB7|nr:uncharacterized protein LOC129600351 [Paramacrobiotus metropolitanus]
MMVPKFKEIHGVTLVEVTVGGQRRRELIPHRHIRDPSADVGKPELHPEDHFVMQTCSVPNGFWPSSESAWLLRQVERRFAVRFFKVLSQEMQYVQRRHRRPLRKEDLAIVFEGERNIPLSVSHRKSLEDTDQADSELKRKKPLFASDGLLALPLEVLNEVFRSLDTVDRQRCRRTCPLWDAILMSPDLCKEVRVMLAGHGGSDPVKWDLHYAAYVCIFNHITPATRTICIRDSETPCPNRWSLRDGDEATDFIMKILEDAGSRIDSLIVYRRAMTLYYESIIPFLY